MSKFNGWFKNAGPHDWLMVLFTAVIAVATIGYVIISGKQLIILAGQLKSSNESFEKTLTEMKAQSKAMQDAASASRSQAEISKKALDAGIATSRLDQRAWLGIGQLRVVQFEKDKSFKADIELVNSGKTPALHVWEAVRWGYSKSLLPGPLHEWLSFFPPVPAESVPPQGHFALHIEISKEDFGPHYNDIKSKTGFIYLFGEIKYRDIFDRQGSVQFCVHLGDPDKPELLFCPTHNNLN